MRDIALERVSVFVHRKDGSDRIGPRRCEVCSCIPRTEHTEVVIGKHAGTWHRWPVYCCGSEYCKRRAAWVVMVRESLDEQMRWRLLEVLSPKCVSPMTGVFFKELVA